MYIDAANKCWCFVSNGLHGVGQAEVVILLSCSSEENVIPKDILNFYLTLYQDASKGRFKAPLFNDQDATFTIKSLTNS